MVVELEGVHTTRLWSWRESTPRPNRETIRFLHAYLGLHCRTVTRPKPPITALSSKTSSPSRGSQETISDLPAPLYLPDSEQHPEERCLVLSPCKRIKPVIYCTSIRQRERTLFRQLIYFVSPINCSTDVIMESTAVTPHAYVPSQPAVKSSQPQANFGRIRSAKVVSFPETSKLSAAFFCK